MSTTNGAGEPSMEEILASIRNIIAQEPQSEDANGRSATEQRAPAHSQQPSFSSSSPANPAATTPSTPFGHRPGQASGSAPGRDFRMQEQGDGGFGAPASPGELRPGSNTAPASGQSSASSATDDFSDVFEEPLQRLPMAGTPVATADTGSAPGSPAREPQLPKGANGAPGQNGQPAPRLPQADRSPVAPAAPASPLRRDFDFGALRPPRKDEAKPVSVASELFGPATTDPAAEASVPEREELARRLTGSGDGEVGAKENAEEPRRQVVIAAMPSKPETARSGEIPAIPALDDTSKSDGIDADIAPSKNEAASGTAPHSANGSVGLKTANVGFLAATPRPIDPREAKASETGRAFFDAIAGEANGDTQSPKSAVDAPENEKSISAAGTDEAELSASAEGGESAGAAAIAEADAAVSSPAAGELAASKSGSETGAGDPGGNDQMLAHGLSVANVVVSSEGGKVRTLEDTVAELLRPLLREWLENNMPRIVESALRLEVAESVKKQLDVAPGKSNGIGN